MGQRRPLPEPKDWEYVVVRRSPLHGRGVFAARDLPRGTYVMEYRGQRIPKAEADKRSNAQWARGRVYTFELNRSFDLDGDVKENVARLANFACEPNCESFVEGGRKVWIVALRDIAAGEEITYDYNFPLVEPPPVCRCGAATCRGYIVGRDHLLDLAAWKELHPHLVARDDQRRKRRRRKLATGGGAPGP